MRRGKGVCKTTKRKLVITSLGRDPKKGRVVISKKRGEKDREREKGEKGIGRKKVRARVFGVKVLRGSRRGKNCFFTLRERGGHWIAKLVQGEKEEGEGRGEGGGKRSQESGGGKLWSKRKGVPLY